MNSSIDQLAERLQELPLDVSRADVITARVLTARRRAPRPPAFLAVAAAFLVLLLASWGVLYFSPATAAALADASGPGGFSGEILNHFGLGTENITAESSTATSSGYKVKLIGAYADPLRTVVLLRITPGAFVSGDFVLTDQFGWTYQNLNAEGNLETGDQALTFEAATWLASSTGMRFTLTLNGVELLGGSHVSGSWTVKGVVLLNGGTTLQTPASGSLGPGTVTFSEARYAGRALSIKAEVRGVSVDGMVPAVGPGTKPQPALSVALAPADGGPLRPASTLSGSSNGDVSELEMLFLNVDPGKYFVVISVEGAGTLRSPIVVR
jgi:hypothetical protein